jgi:hypothetical protein
VPFGDLLVRAGRSPGRDVLRGGGGEVADLFEERRGCDRRRGGGGRTLGASFVVPLKGSNP